MTDKLEQFAIDYAQLQLILLHSDTMKLEYQQTLLHIIDIMQIYGKEHHNLIFDNDKIDWARSFPENYHGNGSDAENWLKKRGYI